MTKTEKAPKSKQSLSNMRRSEAKAGLVFAGPFIIGLLVFTLFPFILSLYYSFTNYNMKGTPTFLGLKNYIIMFTNDSSFWPSFGNTIYHVLVATPITIIFGVGVALLLNNKLKGINIYCTVFYLPNVVSLVAMSLLWLWLFQPSFGLINQMLSPIYKLFGMEPIGWLSSPVTSKFSIALMGLWNCGGAMVIYLAQLSEIPTELYEAANIDGAGALHKLFKITLPLLTPAIFYNVVMTVISGFQMFLQAFIMTKGGPARSTYYFAYYMYDTAFKDGQMGKASALSWVLLVITMITTVVVFGLSKSWVFYLGGEEE